jgi:hypothetical protein
VPSKKQAKASVQPKEETELGSELSRVAMAPASFRCFLMGRPVGMAPLPRPARRASRISCKAASDEKDKLPSRDNVLDVKNRNNYCRVASLDDMQGCPLLDCSSL